MLPKKKKQKKQHVAFVWERHPYQAGYFKNLGTHDWTDMGLFYNFRNSRCSFHLREDPV